MRNINKLIGHNYLFHHLIELNQKNILPNKILLSGNKGIGKFLFSCHFVNYILSQDEEYKYILKNFEINNQNKSYLLFKKVKVGLNLSRIKLFNLLIKFRSIPIP